MEKRICTDLDTILGDGWDVPGTSTKQRLNTILAAFTGACVSFERVTLSKAANMPKKLKPARWVEGSRPYVLIYAPLADGSTKRVRLYPPKDKNKGHKLSQWRRRVMMGFDMLAAKGFIYDKAAPGEVPLVGPAPVVPATPPPPSGMRPPADLLGAVAWALASKSLEVAPRTVETYRVILGKVRAWIHDDGLHGLPLREFSGVHLAALSDHLLRSGLAGVTRNNYFQTLRAIFARLVSAGAVPKNPVASFRKIPERRGTTNTAIPAADAAIILEALASMDPALWRLARLIYWSFARPVELLRLKVGDLGPTCASIHFPAAVTKNRRAAAVPLPPAASAMLREYLEAGDYPPALFLLGTKGTPAERMAGENTFSERHRKVLRAIGMDGRGFNLYSWKHTGAAAAFDAGMSIMELRDRCRHASVQQTEEYLRDLRRVTSHTPPGAW